MIKRFVKGRTFVFIDAANILYSQKTLGWRISYRKLADYLRSECRVESIFFYSGIVGTSEGQGRFLRMLGYLGFIVRAKEVKIIKVAQNLFERKGNLDVELAIDVMKHIHEMDSCILLSGDSDFAPLIDELRAHRKRIIVMSTRGHISRELIERTKYIDLKKLHHVIAQ